MKFMLLLKLLLLSIGLIALAFSGIAIKMLIKKNGTFPEHRVGHSKAMRQKKIFCANTQDKIDRKLYFKGLKKKEEERKRAEMENLIIYNEKEGTDLSVISLAVE